MSKLFPKSANKLPLQIIIYLGVLAGIATAGVTYYMTPKYSRVGYAPIQPVPFSHAQHVKEVGLDCRYCHSNVDKSGHSNVPTAQTCMNCHSIIKANSPLLAPVRESYANNTPVPWVWIHQNPDFGFFNPPLPGNRRVSWVQCHGKVNRMDTVVHSQAPSIAFLIEFHRHPEQRLRNPKDVFNLDSIRLAEQGA